MGHWRDLAGIDFSGSPLHFLYPRLLDRWVGCGFEQLDCELTLLDSSELARLLE